MMNHKTWLKQIFPFVLIIAACTSTGTPQSLSLSTGECLARAGLPYCATTDVVTPNYTDMQQCSGPCTDIPIDFSLCAYPRRVYTAPPYENNPNPLQLNTIDEIYVAPHMDDAPLSAGGKIITQSAEGKKILVITVFGKGAAPLDPFDVGLFSNYMDRSVEDILAVKAMGAYYKLLNYPEFLFRLPKQPYADPPPQQVIDSVTTSVQQIISAYLRPNGEVYFPLAIGNPPHPDHVVLFNVAKNLAALASKTYSVHLWEDMSYAVQATCFSNGVSSCLVQRLDQVKNMGLNLVPSNFEMPAARLNDKINVLFKYTSQIWDTALFSEITGGITVAKVKEAYQSYSESIVNSPSVFVERYYLIQ